MADVFYTILIIWVLWRIFGGTTKHTVHHKHEFRQEKKEGDVTVTPLQSAAKQREGGEYVDFDEVK